MVIEIDGSGYGYYFRYEEPITTCVIYDPKSKSTLSAGHTRRFHKDRPDRRVARKVAFARAVSRLPEFHVRRKLWKHFLEHVRH